MSDPPSDPLSLNRLSPGEKGRTLKLLEEALHSVPDMSDPDVLAGTSGDAEAAEDAGDGQVAAANPKIDSNSNVIKEIIYRNEQV